VPLDELADLIPELCPDVVVPWRYSPERHRQAAHVWRLLERYGLRVIAEGAKPWSPGAARNAGARAAQGDVLLFNDADTVAPLEQLVTACQLAKSEPGLVYGYDAYYRLSPDGTNLALVGNLLERCPLLETFYAPPSLGVAAISRAAFDELGGFDEGFVDWGYEDVDFAQRAAALAPLRRVPGPAWHLWHGARRTDDAPEDSDPRKVARNLWRLESARSSTR
jgi:GT2 family glycosyltransferase